MCQYHLQLFPLCGMLLRIRKEAAGNILLLYIICRQKEGTDLLLGNYFLRKKNTLESISLSKPIYLQKVSVFYTETTKNQTPKKPKLWNRSTGI